MLMPIDFVNAGDPSSVELEAYSRCFFLIFFLFLLEKGAKKLESIGYISGDDWVHTD